LKAINLEWTTRSRLLILIADAPCHGDMYHQEDDDYPKGDPNGLIPEILLSQAAEKNIHLFFARIKPMTDKMIALWKKHMQEYYSSFPLNVFSIVDDNYFFSNITDAIATVTFF